MSKAHDDQKQEVAHEHRCCGYVPLKAIVVFYALVTTSTSVLAIFALAADQVRPVVGGFTTGTCTIITGLGVLGVFFGTACLLSLAVNATAWVRSYVRFAFLRFVLVLGVLFYDWSTLKTCENLSPETIKLLPPGTYSLVLAGIAQLGRCAPIRQQYLVIALLDMSVSLAGAYHASRWCHYVDPRVSWRTRGPDETTRIFEDLKGRDMAAKIRHFDTRTVKKHSPILQLGQINHVL